MKDILQRIIRYRATELPAVDEDVARRVVSGLRWPPKGW